jgi:hypothetical protein
LPNDVGILIESCVLWARERRLQLCAIQEVVLRLFHRDLHRFRVSVDRVLKIEELSGQTLLSVVLRDATKNGALTSRRGADDLPSRFPRRNGNRLENDAARAVHSGLHKIAVTQVRPLKHVLRQRHYAAVADLTDVNHSHVRTSRTELYIQ